MNCNPNGRRASIARDRPSERDRRGRHAEIGVEWDDGQGFALAAVKFFGDFGHAPAQIDQEIVELMFRRTREYLESKAEPVPA